MELVEIDCECKTCGNAFVFRKECHTKHDAETLKRKIEKKKKMVCKDCYRKARLEQDEAALEALNLPQITGKSEKQIHYAQSLRRRFILRNLEVVRYILAENAKINPAKIPPAAKKRNLTNEECVPEAFRRIDRSKEYAALTETDAATIIKIFKEST